MHRADNIYIHRVKLSKPVATVPYFKRTLSVLQAYFKRTSSVLQAYFTHALTSVGRPGKINHFTLLDFFKQKLRYRAFKC